MSAPGTTPGPWKVEGGANSFLFEARIMAGDKCVAFTDGEAVLMEDGGSLFTASPDANLIAAAPCMYAAHDMQEGDLVMLRRAVEEGDPEAELLFRIDDMLRETRAALTRARGEQP